MSNIHKTVPMNNETINPSESNGLNMTSLIDITSSVMQDSQNMFKKAPEYVDLGLSVLWATCNVGANNPWEYGELIAWGETEPKESYGLDNYKFYECFEECNDDDDELTEVSDDDYFENDNITLLKYCTCNPYADDGFIDNITKLQSSDDVATVSYGSGWRIPTIEEFKELINNCETEWVENYQGQGVKGFKFTGKNGNHIFLPAAGYDLDTLNGTEGYYWSSSLNPDKPLNAFHFYFDEISDDPEDFFEDSYHRFSGLSVRAVRVKSFESNGLNMTSLTDMTNTMIQQPQIQLKTVPEYIDLGLSVLWATRNIGAKNPWEYGDFFAWGETEPKDNYSWDNYELCKDGDDEKLTKYCYSFFSGYNEYTDTLTKLQSSDDAASVILGDGWRMPTIDEFKELVNNCKTGSVTNYRGTGVNGYKIIGKNGNHIFLPAAGRNIGTLEDVGSDGYYWSSSLYTDVLPCYAHRILLFAGIIKTGHDERYYGLSVRAVRNK